ncbi:MAG: hypothetical protein V1750_10940 [Acidobacteriota bacterium]
MFLTSLVLLVLVAVAPSPTPVPTPTPSGAPRAAILQTDPARRAPAAKMAGSLAELAKRIRLRMPASQPRVINNENLKELGAGVELTSAQPRDGAAEPAGVPQAPAAAEDPKKKLWQGRYWDAVNRLAALEADERRLQAELARLEQEFYAHDDPAERDGVIKPALDATRQELQDVQAQLEKAREEPDEVLDAARRDGALPGWFREPPPTTTPKQPENEEPRGVTPRPAEWPH